MLKKVKILLLLCFISALPSAYYKAYSLYLKARKIENKNILKSINLYKKSIKIYNKFPEPYFRLGKFYMQKRKTLAQNYFNLTLKYLDNFRLKSEKYKFLITAGEFFEKQKNYKKAIKLYQNSLSLKTNENILFKTGRLCYFLKEYKKSQKFLEKYLSLTPKNDETQIEALKILYNIYMDSEEYQKAMQTLKKIYLLSPSSAILKKITYLSNLINKIK